jgi:hypothetical protein
MRTDVYGSEQVGLVVGLRVEPFKIGPFLAIFRRVRKIATRDYWRRHVCSRVRLSVCMEQTSAPTGWIIVKFEMFRKYVEKIEISLKSDKNNLT